MTDFNQQNSDEGSSAASVRELAATARVGLANSGCGVAALLAIDELETAGRDAKYRCPWCSVASGKRHEEWCPCSASSRRFIRAQYRISDAAGMAAADRLRAAAETISGGGRV